MHIKEDLVYDKHQKRLVGFVNLEEVNNHLLYFQQEVEKGQCDTPLASHMLVFMVRGLFTKLEYPYAQFPCCSASGDHIYKPSW